MRGAPSARAGSSGGRAATSGPGRHRREAGGLGQRARRHDHVRHWPSRLGRRLGASRCWGHSASSMRVGVTSATIPGIPSRVKCRGDQSQHWARTLGETTPPSEQVEDDKPTHHAHHASARSRARAHEAGRPRFAAPGSGRRAGTSAAARPARPPASCAGASPSDRTEPTTRPCLGNPSPGYCARSPVLLARAMSQTPATTTRPTAQAA